MEITNDPWNIINLPDLFVVTEVCHWCRPSRSHYLEAAAGRGPNLWQVDWCARFQTWKEVPTWFIGSRSAADFWREYGKNSGDFGTLSIPLMVLHLRFIRDLRFVKSETTCTQFHIPSERMGCAWSQVDDWLSCWYILAQEWVSLAPRRLSQHSLKICHGFEREQNVCHRWLICVICESFADNFVAALVCQKLRLDPGTFCQV